jgi:hypothetical protein
MRSSGNISRLKAAAIALAVAVLLMAVEGCAVLHACKDGLRR